MKATLPITPGEDQCSVVTEKGERCPWPKDKGTPYCKVHRPILLPTPGLKHGLYRNYLPEGLRPLYEQMFNDPEFFSTLQEIALHRTLLCDYLDRCANHINPDTKFPEPMAPDPHVIALHSELIRRNLESQKGRKYVLGVNGIGMLMEQIVQKIIKHFGDRPEDLRALLKDLRAIEVGPEQTLDHNRPTNRMQAAALRSCEGDS